MDDAYLLAATRYVELNPVRARLCRTPEKYPWSSVHAHLLEENDVLVKAAPLFVSQIEGRFTHSPWDGTTKFMAEFSILATESVHII